MLLALRIALIVTVSGLLVFMIDYTRLSRGRAWRDKLGQTLLIKDLFLIGENVPLLLAVFIHFSTFSSAVATWVLIGFLYLVGLSMYWRTAVFEWEERHPAPAQPARPCPHCGLVP